MLWIKRNLIFVITAVVGLLLAGWAGYSLTNSMSEDKAVKDDFDSVMNELSALRNMNPYPTPENIDAAKAEAAQMRGLLGQFQTVFAPFPAVPAMDEKMFAAELSRRIAQWQTGAKTVAVKLPDPQYAFSFSGLTGQLAFPTSCIPGWLQQFNEMQGILDIVYRAHVNELDGILRVPVYPCDQGGTDFLQTTWVTNQLGVIAPYQISFVCFTRELSQVLDGFITSTNCYLVKSVVVAASKAQAQATQSYQPQQPQQRYAPAPAQRQISAAERYGPGFGGASPTPTPSAPVYAPRASAPSGPATVIREKPLFVTLVVDAIQLKPVSAR
ncbi:MAG: hypothetical protein ACXWDN_02625 [Limisphaerales bacterium]